MDYFFNKKYILFLLKNYECYPYYYLIGTIVFIPDYNIIYIKQPKCGGTTIIDILDKYNIKYIHWVKPINNPTYIDFLNTIDDDYINNCKIITFSRNPYTRIPSALKYIFGLRNIIIDNNTSYIDIFTNKYINNKLQISDIHHYIPTNLISNNKNIYTEIYKFENFNEDVKMLFKKYFFINIEIIIPKNVTITKKTCQIDTKHVNKLIKEYYKEDFILFGYDS